VIEPPSNNQNLWYSDFSIHASCAEYIMGFHLAI